MNEQEFVSKSSFQHLYWNVCYSPVRNNGVLNEHETMCKTFKNILNNELCTDGIKSIIKKSVDSHMRFEQSTFAKNKTFCNEFINFNI